MTIAHALLRESALSTTGYCSGYCWVQNKEFNFIETPAVTRTVTRLETCKFISLLNVLARPLEPSSAGAVTGAGTGGGIEPSGGAPVSPRKYLVLSSSRCRGGGHGLVHEFFEAHTC